MSTRKHQRPLRRPADSAQRSAQSGANGGRQGSHARRPCAPGGAVERAVREHEDVERAAEGLAGGAAHVAAEASAFQEGQQEAVVVDGGGHGVVGLLRGGRGGGRQRRAVQGPKSRTDEISLKKLGASAMISRINALNREVIACIELII